ncbi:MAG: ABC transporter permease subunit, partial [Chloroflexota bacterium]
FLLVVLGVGIWLTWGFISIGNLFFAGTLVLTMAFLTAVYLMPQLNAIRWIAPALSLMILLTIYPMLYTFNIAFTNFSDGHRSTKSEAVDLLSQRRYLPEASITYEWTSYQNEVGEFALILSDADGQYFFATEDSFVMLPDVDELPETYEGYTQLDSGERLRALNTLQDLIFGNSTDIVQIQSMSSAGAFEQRWVYDDATDTLTDLQTGIVYTADDTIGEFVAPDGSEAPIGYQVFVGLENFNRILNSSVGNGPLFTVIVWTFTFAIVGTLTGFAVGLLSALLLNGESVGWRYIRAVLILPYAIPGLISVLIWKGMLNANIGIIPELLNATIGWSPPFATDAFWARNAILLVNIWFSAPYFMLIASGALQSIPSSLYEAASIDGASGWEKFRNITLPLVLISLGPLIIASVIFNFNNFFLMEALFQGGPPIPGTSAPPVGYTDNLISYTYRLAFSAGGTKDYGLASALSVIIFAVVSILTLIQFRFTGTWEEVSENV